MHRPPSLVAALAVASLLGACVDPSSDPADPELGGPDASEPDVDVAQAIGDSHVWRAVPAPPIFRQHFALPKLPAGQTYHFETWDLGQSDILLPDPVINVKGIRFWPWPSSSQWANDSCTGDSLWACVNVPGTFDLYQVTVFPRWAYTSGTFDLRIGNHFVTDDAPFGGTLIPVNVPVGGSYAMQSVHRPHGATDTQLLLYSEGFTELAFDESSGLESAAKLTRTTTGGEKLLVSATSTVTMGDDGLVDVYIDSCLDEDTNCAGDPDRDWLSTALENELGTNPNDRDSDDDGILDYFEVIGHTLDGVELALPRLGAGPRHADLFLEMDMADGAPAGTPWLDDTIMNAMAAIWADLPFANPDGSHGFHVHADGGTCTDPTLCGWWGGAGVVSNACNAMPTVSAAGQNLAPVRHGIFHYAVRTCGPQGKANMPIVRIGPSNQADRAGEWSQEIGHNHGLDHSGPYTNPEGTAVNFKPNYPSCMNYAFQNFLGNSNSPTHFSHGLMAELHPEAQSEHLYSPGVSKTYLSERPYFYEVLSDDVDFDRDGRITSDQVMFDPGPAGERGGFWPDSFELADIGTRVPTGGAGIAVQGIQSGGAMSKVFVAAPFNHDNGTYPEITSQTHAVGFPPGTWSVWKAAPPLAGDPNGEVAAAMIPASQTSVFVTMPSADGRLFFSIYNAETKTWSGWSVMPGWPPGARARQATVVNVNGSLWIAFRDFGVSDDVPNVWITRRDSFGTFDPWQQLATPSYMTPGLAVGPDSNFYLLYMKRSGSGSNVSFSLQLAMRAPAATAFVDVNQILWPDPRLGSTNISFSQRTRLQLVSLPFRKAGGEPFSDGTGYLAAYWNSGQVGADQHQWALRRAYTPGRIAPTGSCFGARVNGGACTATAAAHDMFQSNTSRPWPASSPAVAVRWHGATATYVQSVCGDSPGPREPAYQPWANGIAVGAPGKYTDNNDAATLRQFMCLTLWTLDGQSCKCNGSC